MLELVHFTMMFFIDPFDQTSG